jgi:hypothetical protein
MALASTQQWLVTPRLSTGNMPGMLPVAHFSAAVSATLPTLLEMALATARIDDSHVHNVLGTARKARCSTH